MKQHIFLNGQRNRGLFSCVNQLLSGGVKFLDTNDQLYFDLVSPLYSYEKGTNALSHILDQGARPEGPTETTRPILVKNLFKLNEVYEKHFYPSIKKGVINRIDSFINDNFEGATLGIHVRAADRSRQFGPKWKRLTRQIILNEVRQKATEFDKIFIATDFIGYRELLAEEFGDRVCFYSKNLTDSDSNLLHGNDEFNRESILLEAIIDSILLSRCQFLLRTTSNFTMFTLAANPSLPFLDLCIKHDINSAGCESWLSKNP